MLGLLLGSEKNFPSGLAELPPGSSYHLKGEGNREEPPFLSFSVWVPCFLVQSPQTLALTQTYLGR